MPTVYLLTFASGKQYVGVTNNLHRRLQAHTSMAKQPEKSNNKPMYTEWLVTPPKAAILATCSVKYKSLIELSFILGYETAVPNGYNYSGKAFKHKYGAEDLHEIYHAPIDDQLRKKLPKVKLRQKKVKSYSWRTEWLRKHAS